MLDEIYKKKKNKLIILLTQLYSLKIGRKNGICVYVYVKKIFASAHLEKAVTLWIVLVLVWENILNTSI